MLILSRKRGQKVVISGPCVMTVVEVRGDHIRLGFDAEPEVRIDRLEISELRKANEAKKASNPS